MKASQNEGKLSSLLVSRVNTCFWSDLSLGRFIWQIWQTFFGYCVLPRNERQMHQDRALSVTAWKVFIFGVLPIRIFPHSNRIRRDTPYSSVFSPDEGKYGPEKFRIRTLLSSEYVIYCWRIWRRYTRKINSKPFKFTESWTSISKRYSNNSHALTFILQDDKRIILKKVRYRHSKH